MQLFSRIEGEGMPLLIIHGFLGMSDNWKTLSTQFAALGFQVHALDMRNHGKSFHDDAFNYDVMVHDVKNYLDFHHIEKAILLGHSMGGKVVMLFSTVYPQMVEKLIVADIGPKYYAPHHQKILAALNAVDFSKNPSRGDVETIFSTYISDFGTKQFLLKNLFRITPDTLGFRFNLNVFNEKIEEIGTALSLNAHFFGETLFLRGDKSDYITDADFETIYYHFPKATIVAVPNSGHWLHAENPEAFFCEVRKFIS
ncbi:alpha/beta fold hydrolase [Flavobacterium sp. 20NA77.7]|uniref:Alpha/beta fold hydrolase n=1 Tax=Flavobacterium nakdongensis TaxID=3073563 RepID=A0ABY9RAH2_9FLAO|nr:alpha/beta fold hydrolase [Flavobacterium sp. 20NA77.7]WMW77610.1 alpha/beta fold hydrolase [Flavobacterium sp. 20NA77.7]